MVNLLLSKGANMSAKDKKERQPIHWAAYLGKLCQREIYYPSLLIIKFTHLNRK